MIRKHSERSEEQIKELQEELSLANVKIIPVSATEGDNVTTKSDNIPWYIRRTITRIPRDGGCTREI